MKPVESLLGSRTYELRDTDEFRGSNFDPYRFHGKIRSARLFPGIIKYRPKSDKLLEVKKVETKDKYVFRKDSERWYIKFEGEVFKPENLDGLGFIHYLMENNNKKQITPKNCIKQ